MIQATKPCEHVYKVRSSPTNKARTRRIQYAYCIKCGHAKKNIIDLPKTQFRVHFWLKYALQIVK